MCERQRLADRRQAENAALFRRFNNIGAHARRIDALSLSMARHARLQVPCSQLDGLLHHVVEPRAFEWRKQVVQIARAILGSRLLPQGEYDAALSRLVEFGLPFPVAAIEHQQSVARLAAQDVSQIVRLCLIESNRAADCKGLVDVKARAAEIVCGHGARVTAAPDELQARVALCEMV